MNTTELPAMIRDCIDAGTRPISPAEVLTRAAVTERTVRPVPKRPVPVRPVPVRRRARLGVAATGVAAAGIAGALVASQIGGGTAARTPAVLTAAMLKQVATASQAAMTSGQARIVTATGGSTLVQQVTFDGASWNDVTDPGAPTRIRRAHGSITRTGESISRVVDGQAYHYPAFVFRPAPHFAAEWMHITAPGAAPPPTIPDPRTLLGALSPSARFVTDGHTTVNGMRAKRLRATTPAAVPLRPLNPLIGTEPDSPRVSALTVWVDPSNVVLKARFTVSGRDAVSEHATGLGVTVTVTFSQIGRAQHITAPAHYIRAGGR